jgi:hypothetical protein
LSDDVHAQDQIHDGIGHLHRLAHPDEPAIKGKFIEKGTYLLALLGVQITRHDSSREWSSYQRFAP